MPQSSTNSSADKPVLQCGLLVEDCLIMRKLGSGGYGSVYEVKKDGKSYALKAEIVNRKNNGTLRTEAVVLRRTASSDHTCHMVSSFKWHREDLNVNMIVMSLLWYPLNKLRRACPEQRFSRSTAIRIGMQCLEGIRDLHSVGYLHRDIKAANFALSMDRKVVVVDFGFARRFLQMDRKGRMYLRKPRKYASFLGTSRYCSKHVHERKEQSRRDDLWSWLYMIVEMITGSLPWNNLSDRKIHEYKVNVGSRLYKNCPQELIHIHDHIQSLSYHSKPNYELMIHWLEKVCERCGFTMEEALDWEEDGRYPHVSRRLDMEKDSEWEEEDDIEESEMKDEEEEEEEEEEEYESGDDSEETEETPSTPSKKGMGQRMKKVAKKLEKLIF